MTLPQRRLLPKRGNDRKTLFHVYRVWRTTPTVSATLAHPLPSSNIRSALTRFFAASLNPVFTILPLAAILVFDPSATEARVVPTEFHAADFSRILGKSIAHFRYWLHVGCNPFHFVRGFPRKVQRDAELDLPSRAHRDSKPLCCTLLVLACGTVLFQHGNRFGRWRWIAMETNPARWGAQCEGKVVWLTVDLRFPRDEFEHAMDLSARIFIQ